MATTVHAASALSATLNGQRVYGFADGNDALKVERNADVGTLLVGAMGDSIFSQSSDNSAKITLKLLQTSPSHKLLMETLKKQRLSPRGFPFSFKDRINNEGGSSAQCFIAQEPSVEKGAEATVREWVIVTGDYDATIPNGG